MQSLEITDLTLKRVVGARLREIRQQIPRTILQVAVATGINETRMARIEQGKMLPRADEIRVLARAYALKDPTMDDLLRLVDDGDREACLSVFPPIPRGGPSLAEVQRRAWDLHADVKRFAWIETSYVPGILQVRPYIEAIFQGSKHRGSGHDDVLDDDAREAVAIRIDAQKMLYDVTRTFHFLLPEGVCNLAYGSAGSMAAQCHHLQQISFLPNVRLGLLPNGAQASVGHLQSIRILDDRWMQVEVPFGQVDLAASYQVESGLADFQALSSIAVYDDEARAVLAKAARWWTERSLAELSSGAAVVDVTDADADAATR